MNLFPQVSQLQARQLALSQRYQADTASILSLLRSIAPPQPIRVDQSMTLGRGRGKREVREISEEEDEVGEGEEEEVFESGASEDDRDEVEAQEEEGEEEQVEMERRREEGRREEGRKKVQKDKRRKERNVSDDRRMKEGGEGVRSGSRSGSRGRGKGGGKRRGREGEFDETESLPILNPLKKERRKGNKKKATKAEETVAYSEAAATAEDTASGYRFRFASMDSPAVEAIGAGSVASASPGVDSASLGIAAISTADGSDGGVIGANVGGGDGGGSGGSGGGSGNSRVVSSFQLISPQVLARMSADAFGTTPTENQGQTKIVSYELKTTRKKKY